MGKPEQSDFPEERGTIHQVSIHNILHHIGLDLFKTTFMEIISFAPRNSPMKELLSLSPFHSQ